MSINATTTNLGSLAAPQHRPQPKSPAEAPNWKDFAASTANTAATNTANGAVTDTANSLRANLSALLLQAQEARVR